MPRSHKGFVQIGDALKELLTRLQPPEDTSLELIVSQWNQLAGDLVAQHAHPTKFENGILHVSVDNQLWLQELKRGLGHQIHEKLNALGSLRVRTIRWHLKSDTQV